MRHLRDFSGSRNVGVVAAVSDLANHWRAGQCFRPRWNQTPPHSSDLGRGFTSNGRANNVTIFDLKTLKTIGTVQAGTNPDAIVYDAGTKRVFTMNGRSQDATAIDAASGTVVGTSELVELDPQKLAVLHRWPLAPCQEPSGLG